MHRFQEKSKTAAARPFVKKKSIVGAAFSYFRAMLADLLKEYIFKSLRISGEENL